MPDASQRTIGLRLAEFLLVNLPKLHHGRWEGNAVHLPRIRNCLFSDSCVFFAHFAQKHHRNDHRILFDTTYMQHNVP